MTSSCIPTGLRLDLDMVKAGAAHSSSAGAAYSSPSSTLSEASSSSSVSLKRARAPRKRPNQAYNEAAALLASIHPSVFPVKKSPKTAALAFVSGAGVGAAACSELLTPLPVLADAAFLLRDSPPPSTMPSPQGRPCDVRNCSSPAPVSSAFREFRDPAPSPASPEAGAADEEPGELDFDDDACFDAESILLDADEAAVDGIDGIMGSLTMEGGAGISDDSVLSSSGIHPYLRSLMVVGLAGRFELGLGSGSARHARPNLNRALKRRDDDGGGAAWWMWPAVPVKDITVAPTPPPQQPAAAPSNTATTMPAPAPEKKKSKKKKVVKLEKVMMANAKCEEEAADGGITVDARADGNGDDDGGAPTKAPKTGLGLKLDADDVLKEWAGKGSMFAEGGGPESTESAAEVRAKLADIDLFPENGAAGGIREASVMRYKEKRRNRLFSKKIRYQVRKVNADCRPRMKGRFVRSPSLLQQALDEET